MNRARCVLVAVSMAFGVGAVGCVETLPVPPSRIAIGDTPATVGVGNTEVGVGGGIAGSVFNGSAGYATASVTHGVTDVLDVRADATLGFVVEDSGYVHQQLTSFGMVRMGVERGVVPGVLSLVAGLGGGGTYAGGFVSADAGFLVGYDNRYVSPFAGAVLHVGVPIAPPTVNLAYREGDGTIRDVYRQAYSAFGWVASLGARIPFGGHRANRPHPYALQLSGDFGASYGNDPAIPTTSRDFVTYVGTHLTFRATFGTPRDARRAVEPLTPPAR